MITLIPINVLITAIALTYAVIVVLLIALLDSQSSSVAENLSLALRGGALLNVLLLAMLYFGWRWIWRWFPKLNDWIFPDLNGTWNATIHWVWNGKKGIAKGEACVKQNFLSLSMEMNTDGSHSETLLAKPKKHAESGNPLIYYIYRNTPNLTSETSQPPHEGAAVLRVSPSDIKTLRGNYFTSRDTKGHIVLERQQS